MLRKYPFLLILMTLAGALTAEYPQYSLHPHAPSMDEHVVFSLVLGAHPTTCVPAYATDHSTVHVSNHVCIRPPCPQEFIINVSYDQVQQGASTSPACLPGKTPYGPTWRLQTLHPGNYRIYDQVMQDTVHAFTVSEAKRQLAHAETLIVDGVNYILSSNKQFYTPGERIGTLYTIENNSNQTVAFWGSPGCMVNVVATKNNDTLHSRMEGRICPFAYLQMSVDPGERRFFNIESFAAPARFGKTVLSGRVIGYARSNVDLEIGIFDHATRTSKKELSKAIPDRQLHFVFDPVSGAITIDNPALSSFEVAAFSLDGKQLFRRSVQGGRQKTTLLVNDAEKLSPAGAFVIRLTGVRSHRSKLVHLTDSR
ncbi:MAG: hypothetical protein GF398_08450 [Chitinivibrionales bacterium]|nr:hypothetical protein [Chitinivibrionales bacterium]